MKNKSFTGLSDLLATTILVGLSIVVAVLFVLYIQSENIATRGVQDILQLVNQERTSVLVELLDYSEEDIVILLKRMDRHRKVLIFMFGDRVPINCSEHIHRIWRGRITKTYNYTVDDVFVVYEDGSIGSFRYYAQLMNYTWDGKIAVCEIDIDQAGNTMLVIRSSHPVVEGYAPTEVDAAGRSWRLHGVLEFTVSSDVTLYVNNTGSSIPRNSTIKIYIDSTSGHIEILPRTVNIGEINRLNLTVSALYLNNVLISSGNVHIALSRAPIYLNKLRSGLVIDITPTHGVTGYAKIRHGDAVVFNGTKPVYVRIKGVGADSTTPLQLEFNSTVLTMSRGLSYAVYISEDGSFGVKNIVVFNAILINNRLYVVGKYEYTLG